jgi:hypothetical protein
LLSAFRYASNSFQANSGPAEPTCLPFKSNSIIIKVKNAQISRVKFTRESKDRLTDVVVSGNGIVFDAGRCNNSCLCGGSRLNRKWTCSGSRGQCRLADADFELGKHASQRLAGRQTRAAMTRRIQWNGRCALR